MFTGIIEEIGMVRSVVKHSVSYRISISANKVTEDLKIGDSIATNGICLTVVDFNSYGFTADVMPETLRRTNLGDMHAGDEVNLERAMPLGGRMGGHIVSGHVDGVGIITHRRTEGEALLMTIVTVPEIVELIVPKGSIAIDGISLTVTEVDGASFMVSIVLHTQHETTLATKRVGEKVNLENDILAKYVKRMLGAPQSSTNLLDLL